MTEAKQRRPEARRWKQMGVELEGGWIKSTGVVARDVRGAKAMADQSVKVGYHDGEIITRPHDTLDALLEDVVKLYPDHMNDSCGFHIHASFSPLDGSILASPEFYAYFKERWERWGKASALDRHHEFWNRLGGKNRFCKDEFIPEDQLKVGAAGRGEQRYSILNFCAWEKHGTIECRLLPMFADKSLALAAIRELSDIYDTYLNEHAFAPVTISSDVEMVGDMAIETYESVVPDITPKYEEREVAHPKLETGEGVYYALPGVMHQMLPFADDLGPTEP